VGSIDQRIFLVWHCTGLLPIGMHYGCITSCYALEVKFK